MRGRLDAEVDVSPLGAVPQSARRRRERFHQRDKLPNQPIGVGRKAASHDFEARGVTSTILADVEHEDPFAKCDGLKLLLRNAMPNAAHLSRTDPSHPQGVSELCTLIPALHDEISGMSRPTSNSVQMLDVRLVKMK